VIDVSPPSPRHDAAPAERTRILRMIAEHVAAVDEVEIVFAIGSFAAGRPFRDVDLAVWFSRAPGWQAPARVAVAAGTCVPHDVAIDVIVLNDADSLFKEHIVEHGRLIYERTAGAARELSVMARSEAIDLREWRRIRGVAG